MYKALFFDIDDTLLNYRQSSRAALERTCHCFEIPYSEAVFNAFIGIDDKLWMAQKHGEHTVEDVLRLRFPALFEHLRLGAYTPAFSPTFEAHMADECAMESHAAEIIRHVSGKYKLFAASNGILRMQEKRMAKAGLAEHFEALFVSDNIGHEKPNPAFFDQCLERSKLRPEEILFIGDSIEADMQGAYNSGIAACWYNKKGKPHPEGLKIHHTISDLLELKNII